AAEILGDSYAVVWSGIRIEARIVGDGITIDIRIGSTRSPGIWKLRYRIEFGEFRVAGIDVVIRAALIGLGAISRIRRADAAGTSDLNDICRQDAIGRLRQIGAHHDPIWIACRAIHEIDRTGTLG